MSDTKICSKCGLGLNLSEFSKRVSGSLNARCKTCCRGAIRIQKQCKLCGNTFPATDKTGEKKPFCSPECRRKNKLLIQSKKLAAAVVRKGKNAIEHDQNKQAHPELFEKFSELPKSRSDAIKSDSILYFTGLRCKTITSPLNTQRTDFAKYLKIKQVESAERRRADGRLEQQQIRAYQKHKERLKNDPGYKARVAQSIKKWRKKRGLGSTYLPMRNQRAENPQYIIRDRMQSRLNFILQNAGTKKSLTLEKYLGCSSHKLAEWIGSQFAESMSWENKGEWNIDHIRPCASFDLTEEAQAKPCFNWRNLSPLGEIENKTKQGKYEPRHEVGWAKRMRQQGYDGELFLLFEERDGQPEPEVNLNPLLRAEQQSRNCLLQRATVALTRHPCFIQ